MSWKIRENIDDIVMGSMSVCHQCYVVFMIPFERCSNGTHPHRLRNIFISSTVFKFDRETMKDVLVDYV